MTKSVQTTEKSHTALTIIQHAMQGQELLQAFGGNQTQMRKEMGYALLLIQGSTQLQKCTAESIFRAVLYAGRGGLTLNPQMAQADLIARYNTKISQNEAHYEPRYGGFITKMEQLGVVKKIISCEPVYAKDEFEFDFVDNKILKYVPYWYLAGEWRAQAGEWRAQRATAQTDPNPERVDSGPERCAFIKVLLTNGEEKTFIRGADYINDICSKSEPVKLYNKKTATEKAKSSLPTWLDPAWRPAMIRKTMIKYLWSQLPKPENINLDQMAAIVTMDNELNPIVLEAQNQGQEAIQATNPKKEALAAATADEATQWPVVEAEDLEDWLSQVLPVLGEKPEKKNRQPSHVKQWLEMYLLPRLGITMGELNDYWSQLVGSAQLIELPLMQRPLTGDKSVEGVIRAAVAHIASIPSADEKGTEEVAEALGWTEAVPADDDVPVLEPEEDM